MIVTHTHMNMSPDERMSFAFIWTRKQRIFTPDERILSVMLMFSDFCRCRRRWRRVFIVVTIFGFVVVLFSLSISSWAAIGLSINTPVISTKWQEQELCRSHFALFWSCKLIHSFLLPFFFLLFCFDVTRSTFNVSLSQSLHYLCFWHYHFRNAIETSVTVKSVTMQRHRIDVNCQESCSLFFGVDSVNSRENEKKAHICHWIECRRHFHFVERWHKLYRFDVELHRTEFVFGQNSILMSNNTRFFFFSDDSYHSPKI